MKKRIIFIALLLVLYVAAGLSTFLFVYEFCNVLGSTIMGSEFFQGLGQIYPALAISIVPLALLFAFHVYYSRKTLKGRWLLLIVFGLVLVAWSCSALIYAFVMLYNGVYSNPILGYPTPLYPLSAIIGHIFAMFLGAGLYLYGLKQRSYYKKDLPLRPKTSLLRRGAFGAFGSFFMLASPELLGVLLCSMAFADTSGKHGYFVFALSFGLLLPSLHYAYYWAKELFPKVREFKIDATVSIVLLLLSIMAIVNLFVSVAIDPRAIVEASQAYFPLSFMAGMGIGELLIIIYAILGSAYHLLSCFLWGRIAIKEA